MIRYLFIFLSILRGTNLPMFLNNNTSQSLYLYLFYYVFYRMSLDIFLYVDCMIFILNGTIYICCIIIITQ